MKDGGEMKLIDLTHEIEPSMPVYPGTEPPSLTTANTIASNGFAEKKLTFFSHTGTHMDAPLHMLPDGNALDSYAVANFYGKAMLVDLTNEHPSSISLGHLFRLESKLRKANFLILRTGWAERWGRLDYFEGFPALTPEATRWLVGTGIKGVGIDAISIDRIDSSDYPVHHLLFAANILVIENLTNLDRAGPEFTLACFPLKIKDADGSPVRAVAIIED
jgi:arylformamidase